MLGHWANGRSKESTRYNYYWPWSQWIRLPKVSTRCRTVSSRVLISNFALMVSGPVAYLGMQFQNSKFITSKSTLALLVGSNSVFFCTSKCAFSNERKLLYSWKMIWPFGDPLCKRHPNKISYWMRDMGTLLCRNLIHALSFSKFLFSKIPLLGLEKKQESTQNPSIQTVMSSKHRKVKKLKLKNYLGGKIFQNVLHRPSALGSVQAESKQKIKCLHYPPPEFLQSRNELFS